MHDLDSRAKVFFPKAGNPLRLVGVNMGITARHESEEALAAANDDTVKAGKQLQGIIDNIKDLIATLDTSFCFLAFNSAYAREFKTVFGRDIAIGDSLVDLRFKLNAILAFWIAYVLTRPLGASLGDYLSQSRQDGGLGLGTVVTSVIFLLTILATVIYLAVTKADVRPDSVEEGQGGRRSGIATG